MNIFFFIPIFIQSSLIQKSSEELTALHEPRISTGSNYLSSLLGRTFFHFDRNGFLPKSSAIAWAIWEPGKFLPFLDRKYGGHSRCIEAESQSESEKVPTSMIRSEKTFSGVADMPQSRFPFIVSMKMGFVFRFSPQHAFNVGLKVGIAIILIFLSFAAHRSSVAVL